MADMPGDKNGQVSLIASIREMQEERDALRDSLEKKSKEAAEFKEALKIAYGILWHSNMPPEHPSNSYSAGEGCNKARRVLLAVLTQDELTVAINDAGKDLND